MKAVIMAGGRGERLKPITDTIPKPMIDINGKPILEHIINLFKKYGISEFIFTLCYLPKIITSYFGDGSKFNVNIKYIYENIDNPLGTAGGIEQTKKYINGSFIVTSGDILREINIDKILKFHKRKNAFATLNTYKRFGPNPKSMILFDKQSLIKKFIERPNLGDIKEDFVWANGSFYILEPEIFDYIPANKPADFGKDVFPKILKSDKNMYAFSSSEYFMDIGNLEKLKIARKTFTS